MGIDYSKRGLRLGYMIRGRYVDSAGTAQALRLAGPSSRVGTGHVAADPDEASPALRRYWRAGLRAPTLIDDLGKLAQHIQTPTLLSLDVPLEYPERPDSSVEDTTSDAALRLDVLNGRWINRDVDLWLIDLDTLDTEHRFRGFWSREPQPSTASFRLEAREYISLLEQGWPTLPVPDTTDAWTETRAAGEVDSAYYPGAYRINPAHRGVGVGPIFGDSQSVNEYETIWREVVPYGNRGIIAGGTFWWVHISAQENLFVHEIAAEVTGLADGGILKVAPSFTFLNEEAAAGPLGSNFRFATATGVVFDPETAGHRIYARVSGPDLGQPDATPVGNGAKVEYADTGTATRARVEDILEAHIADPTAPLSLQLPTIFGSTALGDFAADRPISAPWWELYQCPVPQELTQTTPTVREVLADLFKSVPADLVARPDPVANERRFFPLWRHPQVGDTADHVIQPWAFANASPPRVKQTDDPFGEYSNAMALKSPVTVGEPQSLNSGDTSDELAPDQQRTQQRDDLAEQGPLGHNATVRRNVPLSFWNYTKSPSGDGMETGAKLIGRQLSQRQTWTESTLGGQYLGVRLAETLQYQIHGVTDSLGQVRRIEVDLELQHVTLSAVHVVFYDDGSVDQQDEED